MKRPLFLAVLFLTPACADRDEPTALPPLRVRLFDRMEGATLEMPPAPESAPPSEVVARLDFDGERPLGAWRLAVGDDESDIRDEADELRIEDGAGYRGAGLSIGPLAPGQAGAAVTQVPGRGFARYEVTGRTRLDHNTQRDSTSTREALRVLEYRLEFGTDHRGRINSAWSRDSATVHRVSRRIDPSGWDTFSTTFVTQFHTHSIELQLRHQDDGSGRSITCFDDVTVRCTPLVEADLWDHLRADYAPHDGQEAATPWRIRAALPGASVGEEEVRDAVLLPPPSTLSFPLTLPSPSSAPRLRFQYGMLPEAHSSPGDGARIVVRFQPRRGDAIEVGTVEFDPKNNESDHPWQSVTFDLTAVAGRSGVLSFETRDVDGSDADALDAVVLATPIIEPGDGAPDTDLPAAWNVLLIGVDTLRADRLSALGYDRPTTPHLVRLAERGIRFQNARSQAPWTLPSFASILTSLYPSTHGAGRGGHQEWTAIDPGTTSIAELLARVGYETHGVVANGLLSPTYGLDQGFQGYRYRWSLDSADRDVGSVCDFIDAHRATPWLLFWHIMDPHLPYVTEPQYQAEFTDAKYVGRFSARRSVPYEALNPTPGREGHEGPPPAPDLSDADRRYVSDAYDAEVAETDAAIGRAIDALIESGQWDRTVVAVIADHGEGLGDHAHYHHGYTLFEDQVHVPMLLRIPGRDEGRVVNTAVAAIDLMPTLLGALGIDRPDSFHGRDLAARDFAEEQAYFIECPTYDSSAQKAWVEGRYKYLHDPVLGAEALYDITSDPSESTDVSAQHPDVVDRARAALVKFRWERLQRGRFHLRVAGRPGQRLTVAIRTDDVFDANFTTRPAVADEAAEMDLERQTLTLDTTLDDARMELVFWCRGRRIDLDVRLDGEPLRAGVLLGDAERPRPLPVQLDRDEIPSLEPDGVPTPKGDQALLWLDAGATARPPALPSPEELEILKQLGYAR